MSLLYKRTGSPYWYVTKTRQSTKTVNRKNAEEFARKTLSEAWRADTLGEATRTWDDLAAYWLDRKDGLASIENDKMVIRRFGELLERRRITTLAAITSDTVADYAKEVKAAASASTANRHLNTIRAMLRKADSKGWISKAPTIEAYQVTRSEVMWVTIDQFDTITPLLPEWVADMAVMAVQTGMRFSNVAGMQWSWISSDGQVCVVPAVSTKTKRTYVVPLSAVAQAILAKWKGKHPSFVFVGKKRVGAQFFGGKRLRAPGVFVDCCPVESVRYWWESAVDKAGFTGLRWHDLRHTWASLHVQNGTPDRILAAMGGWSSTRMLENYAHLATSHLSYYANNVNSTGTPAESKLSLGDK